MPKVRVAGFSVSLAASVLGSSRAWAIHLASGEPTMSSHGKYWRTLVPSSSVATWSVPFAAPGWTVHGRAGGATTVRTMRQPSF